MGPALLIKKNPIDAATIANNTIIKQRTDTARLFFTVNHI